MSVVMNFAMFPTSETESKSSFVKRVVQRVRSLGFPNQLTAMGTIVETNTLPEALQVIEEAYSALENHCDRVYVTVNIDIRKGETGRINSKVKSVEDKIAQPNQNR